MPDIGRDATRARAPPAVPAPRPDTRPVAPRESDASWAILRRNRQRPLEPFARPREPRHDRADRHARDLADFLVRQPLELAQHDHLAEFEWQRIERLPQITRRHRI